MLIGGMMDIFIAQNLSYTVAQQIIIAHDDNNYINASVYSYNATTGKIKFRTSAVHGTTGMYFSWFVNLSGATGQQGATGISTTLAVLYFNGGDSLDSIVASDAPDAPDATIATFGAGSTYRRILTYDHAATTSYGRYGFMTGTGPTDTINFTGYTNATVELYAQCVLTTSGGSGKTHIFGLTGPTGINGENPVQIDSRSISKSTNAHLAFGPKMIKIQDGVGTGPFIAPDSQYQLYFETAHVNTTSTNIVVTIRSTPV
jgi:hypothetical protein